MRASQYDFKAALATLEGEGGIVTVERPEERIAKAAELWDAPRAQAPGHSLFVVAASNADAEAANRAIREIRRARGELGADHTLPTADGPQAFAQGDRILFSDSAWSRESRDAGLVNGNVGTITRIQTGVSHIPGDGDHSLSAERRAARIRAADGGARKRANYEAV
jgi:ATP-dependent exoDNAse (exonuclease V) alpha subunit